MHEIIQMKISEKIFNHFAYPNLSPCDTWTFFPGAGTYLFTQQCDQTLPTSQLFSYDSSNQSFQSDCAHGLYLGQVSTDKSILTGTNNTFPSAKIVEQIRVDAAPKFQISKSLNNDGNCTCLTLQDVETYLATDQDTLAEDFYPLATWEECVENDANQWFSYNEEGMSKLKANEKCLTVMPIDAFSHVSMDGCEPWNGFSGAGSYLFARDCSDEENAVQGFNYLDSVVLDNVIYTGMFSSACEHGYAGWGL